jgi:Tfp pilus assembly protein PilF
MKTKNYILVIVAVAMALTLTGCFENTRQENAELRWQKTIDQARLEAAQMSIEKGQLTYAQKILEDVSDTSVVAEDARQILAQLQVANVQLAQARTNSIENQAF